MRSVLARMGWWLVLRFSEEADVRFADDLRVVCEQPKANFTWRTQA